MPISKMRKSSSTKFLMNWRKSNSHTSGPVSPSSESRPRRSTHPAPNPRHIVVKISIHIAAAKVRLSLRPAGFPHALSPSGPQDLPTPLPSAVIPGTQKPSPCPRRPPAATISTNRATAGHERTVGTPPRRLTFPPSSSLFPQRHQKTSEQKWTFSHRVNTKKTYLCRVAGLLA